MKTITAHSQHRLTSYQSKVVASTTAGFGLENMDVMFLSFALSSIIAELHLSGTQAGLIATITNIGMLLGGVFFGVLADRVGRIKTFTYTIFIFAFATAAMYFANSLTLIYLCRFLAGIGAGGEYGIGMTVLAESFPKKTTRARFIICRCCRPIRGDCRLTFSRLGITPIRLARTIFIRAIPSDYHLLHSPSLSRKSQL